MFVSAAASRAHVLLRYSAAAIAISPVPSKEPCIPPSPHCANRLSVCRATLFPFLPPRMRMLVQGCQ